MFWRKKPFDRGEVMAVADRARARGRHRRAIKGYRRILAIDPSDPVVHGKLAPLLARTRRRDEALASFELAAQGHLKAGFADRALSVYVQAADHFPERAALWREIARLERVRGRSADAVQALLTGSGHLARWRSLRPRAAELLRSALEIEPWHLGSTLALAKLLARQGQRAEGLALLEALADRVHGKARRRVRAALFRLSPTPANAWRWLRCTSGTVWRALPARPRRSTPS